MYTSMYLYYLLQVEMVAPEGNKLIWMLLLLIVLFVGTLFWYIIKRKQIKRPTLSRKVKVRLEKNKIYRPTIIHLHIENNSANAISIENPIIRFKKIRTSKAFKIKAVNTQNIYPLYLEAGKKHNLPITLKPFYNYNKKLKRYPRIRIEFQFDQSKSKKSSYLLLKPTLFRKIKR